MPRIDPQQLLNTLQVLLNSNGGIFSKDEVQRLASLMTKFSKKLVSKCVYLLILKNSDTQLLGSFMSEGGWNLIHTWLQDAHFNKNWALVKEVLELLLITPVDVERLKMNNLPKLVKSLTKRDDLFGIQALATTLVDEWLKIVKDVTKAEAAKGKEDDVIRNEVVVNEPMEVDHNQQTIHNECEKMDMIPSTEDKVVTMDVNTHVPESINHIDKEKEKKDKEEKKKSSEKSKHKSSSSKSSSSSSSRDKDKSNRDRSKSSNNSSSSHKNSSKDKDRKDKDKHRNSSSKHRSSSSSSKSGSKDKDRKENKEKQAEKDKDTLSKIQPQTLNKIGRIPKKNEESSKTSNSSSTKKEDVKKPTFSVEVRKNEEKPKTVKIFNSKMRSTGLEEEAKPPPPRTATKKIPPTLPPVIPPKRPSPIRDLIPPPEKKSRLLEVPERPGAIKLIPPKPKPAVLQESDIFMDALTAATTKKEVKKRKRRASMSKEASPPPSPATPATPTSPTNNMKSITPANFYQDTLDTEKNKENEGDNQEKPEIPDTPAEPEEEVQQTPTTRTDINGLKGVLSYGKRKGPKKSIKWKPESELVEIQYFELDETERVNVMKPFMDMARMEMTSEREALRSRKLANEDVMDAQISWRSLIEIDITPSPVELGSRSLEKEIQFAREKRVLQALYFNNRIPDSPAEPDVETHLKTNPTIIPLDDPDNPESTAAPPTWPEPRGSPPPPNNPPSIFPNIPGPPFMNMNGPPAGFPPNGIPPFPPAGFIPPNMMRPPGPDWNGIPNGMPPPNMPPPDIMNQGPPIFEAFNPNIVENGFPPPFNGPNNMPPMFPPNNFNNNNNMRGGRGGFRRGGGNNNSGPWLRMAGPGPNQGGWNNNRGGGPPNRGGRFCLNVKKHGYCRNRDNCPFIHPN